MDGHERKERLKPQPLNFVVIGSGQVVDKYWMRSVGKGNVTITKIVSLESEEAFRKRHTNFSGEYHQLGSPDDTFAVLAQIAQESNTPLNIANAATSGVHLSLTQRILSDDRFANARLFIEKPYASSQEDLDAFKDLIKQHSSRLHFSSKYASGRADILYRNLPLDRPPQRITCRLLEGSEYFSVVKERVKTTGDHPYLHDGPELDLGFHLLDIVAGASLRFSGIKEMRIKSVYDLGSPREEDGVKPRDDFEPGYGVGAELELKTKSDDIITVDLQAGKFDGEDERSVEFDYGTIAYRQEYTTGNAFDPVYVVIGGIKGTLARHDADYDYYARELSPTVFCRQTPEQQLLSIFNTEVAMEIERRRITSYK